MTLQVHIFQDSISQVYDMLSEGAVEQITQDVCDLDEDMYKSFGRQENSQPYGPSP